MPNWFRVVGVWAAIVLAAVVGSSLAVATDGFEPAKPGEPTYRIDSVQLGQPEELSELGRAMGYDATIQVSYSWSEDVYPGPASCRIVFTNQAGDVVETQTLEIDSYSRTANTTIPSSVPDSAVAAVGQCSVGSRPGPGSRLLVTDVKIVEHAPEREFVPSAEASARLSATASWADGENPRAQQCELTATSSDGSSLSFLFTAEVGDGEEFGIRVPNVFLGSVDPRVECRMYEGEQT